MSSDVGTIMDKAAVSDRRALFAALQAALLELVNAAHDKNWEADTAYERVDAALDRGVEAGGIAPHE